MAFHYWMNLRIWSKIGWFFEVRDYVSACKRRNKNFFEDSDFSAQLPAYLIENFPQIFLWPILMAEIFTKLCGERTYRHLSTTNCTDYTDFKPANYRHSPSIKMSKWHPPKRPLKQKTAHKSLGTMDIRHFGPIKKRLARVLHYSIHILGDRPGRPRARFLNHSCHSRVDSRRGLVNRETL